MEFTAISSSQGVDIGSAARIVGLQVKAARPFDDRVIKIAPEEKISRYAAVPSIAIWEQVYLDHAVMKPRRRL